MFIRDDPDNEYNDKPDIIFISGKFKPFLELILDLASETGCFTDEQIRAETETIMAAGHDTISGVLTYVLTVLGSENDVQEKAFQE